MVEFICAKKCLVVGSPVLTVHSAYRVPIQVRVLEAEATEQRAVLGKEYVSRHQVEEMQTLFEAAIEGLSNRLRDMEKRDAEKHRQVVIYVGNYPEDSVILPYRHRQGRL